MTNVTIKKFPTQKVLWISIVSSESVRGLYVLEQLEELYSMCESRWNFLCPEETEIEK